ncbi:MAG: caspase family protein [Lewinellaceae bacterium]|nr:caspase family protein [Lewinellaceae bacterium]
MGTCRNDTCSWAGIVLLTLWFLTISFQALPAQEKGQAGLQPVSSIHDRGTTRAVVVGISDYQHPDIPDLRFAHRDAEAFVAFLRSPSGGQVPDSRIRLLTNAEATAARFDSELQWLVEASEPGDKAYIYFSGHGDVERYFGQEGFLLCADAAPRSYASTGSYGVHYLKQLVGHLSEKRVRVILITDACHAGKLAGSPIGGPQLVAKAMRDQFTDEIKIMACQPNEKSYESPSLGGGRGAFSYFLIDGLNGQADENGDGLIHLRELMRFVSDNVHEVTTPFRQNPVYTGDAEVTMSLALDAQLASQDDAKDNTLPVLAQFDSRAYQSELLMQSDSQIHALVTNLMRSLEEKRFFMPAEDCADVWYNILIQNPKAGDELKRYILRTYAVALQEDAQQAVLHIMDANLNSGPETRLLATAYAGYPRQLARSAELLGRYHPRYTELKAREKWVEGFLYYADHIQRIDSTIGETTLDFFRSSLALEANAPIVHYYMALTWMYMFQEPDSAIHHVHLANQLAPYWVLPNAHIGTLLSKAPFREMEKSERLFQEAMAMDSTNHLVLLGLGLAAYQKKDFQQAESLSKRLLQQDSSACMAWSLLAACVATPSRYDEAEQILAEGIRHCPETAQLKYVYGCILGNTNRPDLAAEYYRQSLAIRPKHSPTRDSLGLCYYRSGRTEEAIEQYRILLELNPNESIAHYRLACIAFDGQDSPNAARHLKAYFESRLAVNRPPDLEPGLEQLLLNPELKAVAEPYLKSP